MVQETTEAYWEAIEEMAEGRDAAAPSEVEAIEAEAARVGEQEMGVPVLVHRKIADMHRRIDAQTDRHRAAQKAAGRKKAAEVNNSDQERVLCDEGGAGDRTEDSELVLHQGGEE